MNGALLTGATVWAGADCQPRPGWLLVSGDRIVAAGTAGQPPPAAGRVLDLPGRHVLPGSVDAHQHPTLTAGVPQDADGIGWPDLPTALAAIRAAAVANASSPWLVFWNALPHTWPRRLPAAAELDLVAPGRQVLVSVRGLHRVATSSAGWPSLGWAPRPVGGRQTSRDRRGRPTGELWEPAYGAAVATGLTQTEQHLGAQQGEAALRAELDCRLGYVYTHVHDAYVPPLPHQRMLRLTESTAPRLLCAIGSGAGIFAPGAGPAEFPAGCYAGARPCPVGKFGWCTEVAPSEAAREPKAGGRTWLLPILLTAVFMTTADNSIVNVAVPSIAVGLRATGGELELAVSAYILAYAVLLVTGARLGSIYGYRRAFLAGLALFTLGSLACGLGPNPVALILARIVQGIGAAIMVPQVLTDIQLSFEGTDRARALALYPAALAGGAAAGQVLGGALISLDVFGSSWRPVFLVNVPIGAALHRRSPGGWRPRRWQR